MKLTQFEMIAIAGVAALGVFYLYKQKDIATQFQNAYNVLAGEVASGKLVYSNSPAAGDIAAMANVGNTK